MKNINFITRNAFLFFVLILASCGDDEPMVLPPNPHEVRYQDEEIAFTDVKALENIDGYFIQLKREAPNLGPVIEIFFLISNKADGDFNAGEILLASDNGQFKAIFRKDNEPMNHSVGGILNLMKSDLGLSGTFEIELNGGEMLFDGIFTDLPILNEPIADFTQINLTDFNGAPIGGGDDSDWKNTDNWSLLEESLFTQFASVDESLVFDSATDLFCYPAYPNPFTDVFNWNFQSEAIPELEVVIVNDNFEIVRSFSNFPMLTTGGNVLAFQLTNEPFVAPNRFYRMYYRIHSTNGVAKGHGDLNYTN